MKNYSHNEMEKNVILELMDFLGLPRDIRQFELKFEVDKDPIVLYKIDYIDGIFTKKINVKNSNGDNSKSIIEEMALQIAGLFAEIPKSFISLKLRFEASEIPIITVTCELWSAYEDPVGIKNKILGIKNNFTCKLKEIEENNSCIE